MNTTNTISTPGEEIPFLITLSEIKSDRTLTNLQDSLDKLDSELHKAAYAIAEAYGQFMADNYGMDPDVVTRRIESEYWLNTPSDIAIFLDSEVEGATTAVWERVHGLK